MPQIKVDYIVSFSSEDATHKANNLLSNDIVNKKWVGQEKGGASNSVVLQLEKSSQITSIHIGNYNSALVEVLVGRSEAVNQNYEVLLSAHSFMTPSDSRNSVNESRVRTFSVDQLAAGVREQSWDRVRVVCTQPYNKHLQFGLSFIHFFSSGTKPSNFADKPSQSIQSIPKLALTTPNSSQSSSNSSQETPKPVSMLGKFKLRAPSSDEDEPGGLFKPGELFARLKDKSLSTDALIRQAGLPKNTDSESESKLLVKAARPVKVKVDKKTPGSKDSKSESPLSRKNIRPLYYDDSDEESESNKRIDKIIKRDQEEKEKKESAKKDDVNLKPSVKHSESKDKEVQPKACSQVEVKPKNKTPARNDSILNNSKRKDAEPKREVNVKDESKETKKRQHSNDRDDDSKKRHRTSTSTAVKHDIANEISVPRGTGCLRGVVFVLSGYMNPKRATLRDMATALGARYSPDWTPKCTHLVCAFANTPKHDQVKRSGVDAAVVSGQWIEECSSEEAHLPWKWFAMDPKQKTDRVPLQKPGDQRQSTSAQSSRGLNKDGDNSRKRNVDRSESTKDDINKKNNNIDLAGPSINIDEDSGENTDDDIEKFMLQQKIDSPNTSKASKVTKPPLKSQISDDSDATDIDDDLLAKVTEKHKTQIDTEKTPIKNGKFSVETESDSENLAPNVQNDESFPAINILPDFFSGIVFYVHPRLVDEGFDLMQVERYILAYDGKVLKEWPEKSIDVAITTEEIVGDLLDGKSKKCKFIRPEWIWKCNDTKTLYSYDEYTLS